MKHFDELLWLWDADEAGCGCGGNGAGGNGAGGGNGDGGGAAKTMNEGEEMPVRSDDDPTDDEWGNPPDMSKVLERCPHALDFVYGATILALHYVNKLDGENTSPETVVKVQKRVKRILRDIRKMLKECPENPATGSGDPDCCTRCAGNYTTCRQTKPDSYCMPLYSNCVSTCNPSC